MAISENISNYLNQLPMVMVPCGKIEILLIKEERYYMDGIHRTYIYFNSNLFFTVYKKQECY